MNNAQTLAAAINALSPDDEPVVAELFPGAVEQPETIHIRDSRWYERIADIYLLPDGTYAAVETNRGLTEIQEGTPPEAKAYEVEPHTVSRIEYRPLPQQD